MDTLKSIIDKVFVEKLKKIPKSSVESLCAELFKAKLISAGVATLDGIIEEFKTSLDFEEDPSEIISMCSKFLTATHSVPGPCEKIANKASKDLAKEIKNRLNIDVVLL